MPVVHIHYIHDLTKEQKKDLTASVTKAVHQSIGVPEQYVQIWLHQTSAQDHSISGILLEEMKK